MWKKIWIRKMIMYELGCDAWIGWWSQYQSVLLAICTILDGADETAIACERCRGSELNHQKQDKHTKVTFRMTFQEIHIPRWNTSTVESRHVARSYRMVGIVDKLQIEKTCLVIVISLHLRDRLYCPVIFSKLKTFINMSSILKILSRKHTYTLK